MIKDAYKETLKMLKVLGQVVLAECGKKPSSSKRSEGWR